MEQPQATPINAPQVTPSAEISDLLRDIAASLRAIVDILKQQAAAAAAAAQAAAQAKAAELREESNARAEQRSKQ